MIWIVRAVVWALLLLIGYRGVAAIVAGVAQPAHRGVVPSAAAHVNRFPASLAQAYALEFGQVYLSFSPATAQRRAAMLAAFLPPGSDPQLNWNGSGTQTLVSEHVAGIRVLSAQAAVVSLLAQLGSGRLIELQVPVYASGNGLVVSGQPALLPAPGPGLPPHPARAAGDPALRLALERTLPAFFRAFASGDKAQLGKLTAPGSQIRGLGGVVTFGGLGQLTVPAAGGATRHITATVRWLSDIRQTGGTANGGTANGGTGKRLTRKSSAGKGATRPSGKATSSPSPAGRPAPARLEMTYAITVVRRNGTWVVSSIGAAVTQPGPPA